MINFLKKHRESYQQYLHDKAVVNSFSSWVLKSDLKNTTVHFDLKTIDTVVALNKSRTGSITDISKPNFIVTSNINLKEHQGFYASKKGAGQNILFSTHFLKIIEISNKEDERKIRHGLTNEERTIALRVVRSYIEKFVTGRSDAALLEEEINKFPIFKQKAGIDVVLWVDGKMRGSTLNFDIALVDGLKRGAVTSFYDYRFKQIESHELDKLTIEINILSDLYIPVPANTNSTILTEDVGYRVTYEKNSGWYLPSVFNVRAFMNYKELFLSLAKNKAYIPAEKIAKSHFSMFSTNSFIEDPNTHKPLLLDGSMITSGDSDALPEMNIHESIEASADWLCRIQSKDGFIPLIISPYTYNKDKADWVRMSLTAYSLILYGKTTNQSRYIEAGTLCSKYILNLVDELALLPYRSYILVSTHLARIALLMQDDFSLNILLTKLSKDIKLEGLSTISRLQIASLYLEVADGNPDYFARACEITLREFNNWEGKLKNLEEVSYAEYAELINLLYSMQKYKNKDLADVRVHYDKITKWYKESQNTNGSFPHTKNTNYTYTRGTGKIFESLSIDPTNAEACLKSLNWVISFQYNKKNMFNVPENEHDLIFGSFMHDKINHSSWIDSVAHILIGVARLKENKIL